MHLVASRRARLALGAVLSLAACGDPAAPASTADRIDALLARGVHLRHSVQPSRARMAEIYPGREFTRNEALDDPDAAAVVRAGRDAVPELVRLLDDPRRNSSAAYLLGEIDDTAAATALLDRWRTMRGLSSTKEVYEPKRDGDLWANWTQYEGGDGDVFLEVLFGLSYLGRRVSSEVARDTMAALDEADRLQALGDGMTRSLTREESGRTLKVHWNVEPVQTACEGLKILAMSGADDGVAVVVRALRSSIGAVRWCATQNVQWLGRGSEQTLPELGRLLDEAGLRREAVHAVAFMLDRNSGFAPDEEVPREATRLKARLQELGHLPK